MADGRERPPLPEPRIPLGFKAMYSAAETRMLRIPVVPLVMEERWAVRMEDEWLIFRRSWTGFAVFGIELQPAPKEGCVVRSSWVSRDREQYISDDLSEDRQTLEAVIRNVVLQPRSQGSAASAWGDDGAPMIP